VSDITSPIAARTSPTAAPLYARIGAVQMSEPCWL
jgi:hypothetical protein